jgi:MoxR-like ATPase
MKFLQDKPGDTIDLAGSLTVPELVHVFDAREIDAVNAALAAKRPLLVRGEPGIGKSQLARAAAKALGRVFVSYVVDSRTESRDLLWHFDAVSRLAEAQLLGALRTSDRKRDARASVRTRLAVSRYLHPRPLWWAFDWADALRQAEQVGQKEPPQQDGGDPDNGCLVLIDEIDKAESDVPNGLLEALGAGSFAPVGRDQPVIATGEPPLVIITTNEERALPDAFVRRCLVVHLHLPKQDEKLIAHLTARARAHFPLERFPRAEEPLLHKAAELLVKDRETAEREHWLPLPGQAEYLDLVRAVLELTGDGIPGGEPPDQILERVAGYVLAKHPDAFKRRQEASG